MVSRVTADAVYLGDEMIPARTVFWAAGMAASPLTANLGEAVPLDRSGRVRVAPDLTLPGHSEVYVIGDAALLSQDDTPLPGVAPVAIQMGEAAAENVWRTIQGRPRIAFRYRDRGLMATIGRNSGVAQIGRLQLTGFIGWLAWLFVHILFLIGFENRMQVLFKWAWMYLTYQRDARLITRRSPTYVSPERNEVEASLRS
jgi:NADH dehydrogenase